MLAKLKLNVPRWMEGVFDELGREGFFKKVARVSLETGVLWSCDCMVEVWIVLVCGVVEPFLNLGVVIVETVRSEDLVFLKVRQKWGWRQI